MVGFGNGNDGCIRHERDVDARVRHQICRELREVYVECSVKPANDKQTFIGDKRNVSSQYR